MQKIYNRAQIIKKVAKDLDITQVNIKKIVTELESQIIELGLARGQVRIKGLGMFKFYKRKSTTIKQIRTKKNRLVLSLKVVKFIATESFKRAIRDEQTTAQAISTKSIRPEKTLTIEPKTTKSAKPKKATVTQSDTTDRHRITLQKFSHHGAVSKDRFDKLIKERLTKYAKTTRPSQTKKYLDDTPDGKILLSIFKLAQSQGQDKVSFVFENDITYIFTGKPRELLGKLSNNLCQKFFSDHFDLDNLEIPQERTGLLEFKHKNRGIIILSIHSLPTFSGASVVANFKIK